MACDDFALFQAFPALVPHLPRHPFLSGATPVESLLLPGAGAPLLVKRDERCCPLYGGNKPRKLELLIGAARARGSRRLVTAGGLGTHHGLATTILGREAGMASSVVMVDQPLTPEVEETLRLHVAWGAEMLYGGGILGAAWQAARVLARSFWDGERPTWVPTGGSSALGTLGFVSAAFELARQVREDGVPEPEQLWIAVGSGGSLAGLVVGLRLAGLSTRCVGVLVTDILPPSRESLARRAQATLRLMRRLDPGVPKLHLSPGDFDLLTGHVGPGYGASTPEAEQAVAAAGEAGLRLETTYTGKCLAALLPRLGDPLPGPILFWNTFNAVDVAGSAPTPPGSAPLPEPFQRILARARPGGGPRAAVAPFPPPSARRIGSTHRRGFLRLAGSTAALGALCQVRALPARAEPSAAAGRFFDASETEILTQVMERVVDTGRPEAPRVRDTDAVAAVDTLCRQLDPSIAWPLPYALRLFEWAPVFLDLSFSRFTRMSDDEKDASLRAWMNSRFELRRLAFLAVRNLCFVGFYSQEETWPLIGYRGPLLQAVPAARSEPKASGVERE